MTRVLVCSLIAAALLCTAADAAVVLSNAEAGLVRGGCGAYPACKAFYCWENPCGQLYSECNTLCVVGSDAEWNGCNWAKPGGYVTCDESNKTIDCNETHIWGWCDVVEGRCHGGHNPPVPTTCYRSKDCHN